MSEEGNPQETQGRDDKAGRHIGGTGEKERMRMKEIGWEWIYQ